MCMCGFFVCLCVAINSQIHLKWVYPQGNKKLYSTGYNSCGQESLAFVRLCSFIIYRIVKQLEDNGLPDKLQEYTRLCLVFH